MTSKTAGTRTTTTTTTTNNNKHQTTKTAKKLKNKTVKNKKQVKFKVLCFSAVLTFLCFSQDLFDFQQILKVFWGFSDDFKGLGFCSSDV